MSNHQQTVAALYSAFGQGDVPFILASVAENFTLTDPSNPAITGRGGTRTGRDGFGSFFQAIMTHSDTILWEVNDYVSEGDTVVAMGKHGLTHKVTGKSVVLDWVMVWRFGNEQPISCQIYYGTAEFEAIFTD